MPSAASAPPGFTDISTIPDYIVHAIPYFFLAIGVELVFALLSFNRKVREPLYRINDAVNSVSLGLLDGATKMFTGGLKIVPYVYLYERFRIYTLPVNITTWIITFVLVEVGYYWFHRLSHEVNVMWAAHQVHHSSEGYALTTALRQSALQHLFSWVFYLPAAVLGLAPVLYLVHTHVNTLYQFWIHTRAVKKLPRWIEYIFNTPSHHRVHHGRNPYCIDKNYGGTLIIFDRLFGTFIEEKTEETPHPEEVRYGLVGEVQTWDPIYHNLFKFYHILHDVVKYRSLKPAFLGPAYNPEGEDWEVPEVPREERSVRWDADVGVAAKVYILTHFVLLLTYTTKVLNACNDLSFEERCLHYAFMMYSTWVFGAMFDGRRFAYHHELNRLGLISIFAPAYILPYLFVSPSRSSSLWMLGSPWGSALLCIYVCSVVWSVRGALNAGKEKKA